MGTALLPFAPSSSRAAVDPTPTTHTHWKASPWRLEKWPDLSQPHGFPGGSAGKESACNVGDLGLIPGWEDPLEKEMATHSSILAWRILTSLKNKIAWLFAKTGNKIA